MGQKGFYDGKGTGSQGRWEISNLTSNKNKRGGVLQAGATWAFMCVLVCACASVGVTSLCVDEFICVCVWMGVRPCV